MKEKYSFEDELRSLIRENTVVSIKETDFNYSSDLIVDFGYDSLSIVRLIADIERKFNIEFEVSELVSEIISNYGNLNERIHSKINEV